MKSCALLLLSVLSLIGCDEKPSGEEPAEDTGSVASSGETGGTTITDDTEGTATDDTSGATGDLTDCASQGLSEAPFSDGPYGTNYGDLVEDFTLNTLSGEWSLSESWSGCDSYLFVNYAEGYDYPGQIWASDVEAFLESSPENVHYFFMSYDQGSEEEQVSIIAERIEETLSGMSDEEQARWRPRLHYVLDSAWYAGSIGDALQPRGAWAIAIDRSQRLREVGYLAVPDNTGNWVAGLRSLTFEARYFNAEVEQQASIDALGATPITVFDGSALSSGYADVVLPDAATMAGYDTLHMELELGCGDPFYENCGEWDYLIEAYVCDQPPENTSTDQACQPAVAEVLGLCHQDGVAAKTECREAADCGADTGIIWSCEGYDEGVAADTLSCDCTTPLGEGAEAAQTCNSEGTGFEDCACACDTEIGRWVTAYARGGRWVFDASPMLAVVGSGEQTFRFRSSYSYENTLTFHLSDSGKAASPQEAHYLFGGGSFNSDYNSAYAPITIDIPDDAARVELYAVISGHGWGAEVENCAEFCNHTHHFTINGVEYVKDHPEAGAAEGCIEQIDIGTSPNQFGTWPYGRGGWCPGKDVTPFIVDVTDAVTPGETATITYQGLFEGADYVPVSSGSGDGFGANIDMDSYLVISR